jgi:hypothetical protein
MVPPVISPASPPLPRGDGGGGFGEALVCGVVSVMRREC